MEIKGRCPGARFVLQNGVFDKQYLPKFESTRDIKWLFSGEFLIAISSNLSLIKHLKSYILRTPKQCLFRCDQGKQASFPNMHEIRIFFLFYPIQSFVIVGLNF